MDINFINNSYRRFYKAHQKELENAIGWCLQNGELTLRKDVSDFEESLAKFIGTKYAVGVNSGTDALLLSLKAIGVKEGDEVITVSNTFIAPIQVIIHCGATPILVDVKENELMDMEQVKAAITPKTKCIIPVHYTGSVCDMSDLKALCDKKGIYIVEDACQALGAVYGGKKAGSMGDTGCFSFNTAKLMGAYGDGGAVTTNDKEVYKRLMLLRNHWNMSQLSVKKEDFPQPDTLEWGWKSRLDNIQAAVLNVKIKYLPEMLARRKEIAETYIQRLAYLEGGFVKLPDIQNGRVWQEFHLQTEPRERKKLVEYLKDKGIETLIRDSIPNHKQKGLGLSHFNLPVTERLAKSVLRLPLYPELTNLEVDTVIGAVQEFYDGK